VPLLASTLTTILAFMPFVLVTGSTGNGAVPIARDLIVALLGLQCMAMCMLIAAATAAVG